jgi:tRNA A37 methylthiotransferase MiaB
MKRPYTTEQYFHLLRKIRAELPEAAIAADIMAGFPGETEDDHREAWGLSRAVILPGYTLFLIPEGRARRLPKCRVR